MAKETKFIEVEPNEVESTIEIWQNFGWELIGAPQEIYNKTTHRTQETDKHYSTEYTSTTHYVKITFQREKSMPHYDELVQLENVYYTSPPSAPSEPIKSSAFGCLWFILIVAGLFAFVVPGIIIIIWRTVKYKKNKKTYEEEYSLYKKNYEKWQKEYEDWNKQCQNAFNKAKSLIQ